MPVLFIVFTLFAKVASIALVTAAQPFLECQLVYLRVSNVSQVQQNLTALQVDLFTTVVGYCADNFYTVDTCGPRHHSDVTVSYLFSSNQTWPTTAAFGLSVWNVSANQSLSATFVSSALMAAVPSVLPTLNITVFWTGNLSILSTVTQLRFSPNCTVEVVPAVTAGRKGSGDEGSNLPIVISTTTAAGVLFVGLVVYVYQNMDQWDQANNTTEVRSVHLQRMNTARTLQGHPQPGAGQRSRAMSGDSSTFPPTDIHEARQKRGHIKLAPKSQSVYQQQQNQERVAESSGTENEEIASKEKRPVPSLMRSLTVKHLSMAEDGGGKEKEKTSIPRLVRSLTARHIKLEKDKFWRKGSAYSDPGMAAKAPNVHSQNDKVTMVNEELESLHGATVATANITYLSMEDGWSAKDYGSATNLLSAGTNKNCVDAPIRNEASIAELLEANPALADTDGEAEESLPVWEPQFETCTDIEAESFREYLEMRKREVEQWARSEALAIDEHEILATVSPVGARDKASLVDEQRERLEGIKMKFQSMRGGHDTDEREVIVAENFVPGGFNGCLLYTYWEYSPKEAYSALLESSDDLGRHSIESGEKQHYFACAADDFVLEVGLNPAYQEVLLAQGSFSPELSKALSRRGWVQRHVNLDEDNPYARFNDWAIVGPRLLGIKELQAEAGTIPQNVLLIDREDNGNNLRRRLIQKQVIRSNFSGNFLENTGLRYRVFTRDGMFPLHYDSLGQIAKRISSKKDMGEFPLNKRARLRWVVVRGKVVKKKRRRSENLLSTHPGLSPVPEVASLRSTPSHCSCLGSRQASTPTDIPHIVIMDFDRAYFLADDGLPNVQSQQHAIGKSDDAIVTDETIIASNQGCIIDGEENNNDETIVYEDVLMDDDMDINGYSEVHREIDPSIMESEGFEELYEEDENIPDQVDRRSPAETFVLSRSSNSDLGYWV